MQCLSGAAPTVSMAPWKLCLWRRLKWTQNGSPYMAPFMHEKKVFMPEKKTGRLQKSERCQTTVNKETTSATNCSITCIFVRYDLISFIRKVPFLSSEAGARVCLRSPRQ